MTAMKTSKSNILFFLFYITILLSSCSIVGDIFKAGMGFGIFIVVAIIIAIIYFAARINKK